MEHLQQRIYIEVGKGQLSTALTGYSECNSLTKKSGIISVKERF